MSASVSVSACISISSVCHLHSQVLICLAVCEAALCCLQRDAVTSQPGALSVCEPGLSSVMAVALISVLSPPAICWRRRRCWRRHYESRPIPQSRRIGPCCRQRVSAPCRPGDRRCRRRVSARYDKPVSFPWGCHTSPTSCPIRRSEIFSTATVVHHALISCSALLLLAPPGHNSRPRSFCQECRCSTRRSSCSIG